MPSAVRSHCFRQRLLGKRSALCEFPRCEFVGSARRSNHLLGEKSARALPRDFRDVAPAFEEFASLTVARSCCRISRTNQSWKLLMLSSAAPELPGIFNVGAALRAAKFS